MQPKIQLEVCQVSAEDYPKWLIYWQAYQDFYHSTLPAEITALTWARFFDVNEPVYCLVAKHQQQLLGFVTYVLHRSTWASHHYCYLEDLFVDAQYRGLGIAHQLIYAVQQQAKQLGAERLYWHTQQSNQVAQRLYDDLAEQSGMIEYRMPL